jgi:hemerythrin-like domain-containing protein
MWSIDVLREEHRWILVMLACLERVLADSERRGHLEADGASELLSLLTRFVDGLHQEREERHLFPRILLRARSVVERVEIGRLCGAHEEERRALGRMGRELLGAIYGDPRSLADFRREARRYVQLQRAHLAHENRDVLPLAEFLLTPEDDRVIVQGYSDLEPEGPEPLRQVFRRVEALAERLGVPPEEGASTP